MMAMATLENLKDWFRQKGLQGLEHFAAVLIVCVLILWAVRLLAKAVRRAIGRDRVLSPEAERRAKTLGSVLENTARILVVALLVVMTLQEFGINISPLIAGAGIAGVAVGFGAQSLVKDVIAGFFLLMENQYSVGDIISVDERHTGTVERMTLRITQIRDTEGQAHIIPNGTINQVVIMSKDFSRAMVDVEIRADQDVDRVIEVLREIGAELLKDFPVQVLEATDVKGVEALTAAGCTLRTLTKTAPGKQWDVARELRRRILLRFRLEGIAMPVPERVIWNVSKQG